GNLCLAVAPFLGLEHVAHDDLGLDRVGHFDADGAFAGDGGEDVNPLGFDRGRDVVGEGGDFFKLHARRRMKFVTRDGRAFGDVAERNFDLELGERLLHQPRVGHQFLLGLRGLYGQVRVLEKIQRRQLIIADDGRRGDRERLPLFGRGLRFGSRRHGTIGDVNGRFRFFTIGLFHLSFFRNPRFGFGFNWFSRSFGLSARHFFCRGGSNSFAWWRWFFLFGGTCGFSLFGRFRQSGFAHASGRRFGLRHAQVANGRFRHRQQIRAQTGTLDFLLQFFGLLLEVTRAAFERGFIGGFGFGGGG